MFLTPKNRSRKSTNIYLIINMTIKLDILYIKYNF